jgi:hypothetical protein
MGFLKALILYSEVRVFSYVYQGISRSFKDMYDKGGFSRPIYLLFCSLNCCMKPLVMKMLAFAAEANYELAQQLGFEKVEDEFLEEYKSNAILYRHKKTGAEVMSVINDDENKVFGIVFRTPP